MQYTNNSYRYSGTESFAAQTMDRTGSLLHEQYMQELNNRYPCEEPLERCEPEAEDVILFFAKGCKIPAFLENRPYAIIPGGRLVKVS